MTTLYWAWRRELAVMLRAPIVYVIGGLFLVVQGVAFAGLVNALSDARRPAPLGALLEGLLAGTLLTWLLQLIVLTMLGMRTIADERRTGGWELLLTAGVGETSAVVGAWLAATTTYAVLWLPTLSYLGVVAAFRADPGGWDLATVVTGYVGAIALGSALLAWVVAASAATSSMLAAAGLGFGFVAALFFIGELASVAPDFAADHPSVARFTETVSLRAVLVAFARGDISLSSALVIVGTAATGLSLAVTLACLGRRRSREVIERAIATALIAAIAVLSGVWAGRHPYRIDVTASKRNSIDPATRDVVADLPTRASLTIIAPTLGGLASLYDEVTRIARRMAEAGPLTVRTVDPATLPGGIDAAAKLAGLQPKELADGGGVVVEVGDRRKIVDVFALASFDRTAAGTPIVADLAIEQSLSGALAELAQRVPITVCATTSHGEMSLTAADDGGADWTAIGNRLRGDGLAVVEIDSVQQLESPSSAGGHPPSPFGDFQGSSGISKGHSTSEEGVRRSVETPGSAGVHSTPEEEVRRSIETPGSAGVRSTPEEGVRRSIVLCDAVIVAGPTAPWSTTEALAVQHYVRGGGGLLIAAASRPAANGTGFVPTGLEGLLAAEGLGMPGAVAVDPTLAVREIPGAVLILNGYSSHQINAGFAAARRTLWVAPRVVVAHHGATPLVFASEASWGERDLDHAPPQKHDHDLRGPVAVAALGSAHRVIAIGSAESVTNAALAGGSSAGDLWIAQAVKFVAGRSSSKSSVGKRAAGQVRLAMTASERRMVIGLSVAGIPLAWLVFGGALVAWRRRSGT